MYWNGYEPLTTWIVCLCKICGLVCQKQVSRAGICNYIPQILGVSLLVPPLDTCFWHTSATSRCLGKDKQLHPTDTGGVFALHWRAKTPPISVGCNYLSDTCFWHTSPHIIGERETNLSRWGYLVVYIHCDCHKNVGILRLIVSPKHNFI